MPTTLHSTPLCFIRSCSTYRDFVSAVFRSVDIGPVMATVLAIAALGMTTSTLAQDNAVGETADDMMSDDMMSDDMMSGDMMQDDMMGEGMRPVPLEQIGWRADVPVLRVGILGSESDEEKREAWEGWRRFVEMRLGVPVDLLPLSDYGAALRAMLDGRLEYMPLGASGYIELDRACSCVEPLVVVEDDLGSTGFRSYLVSLADGPVEGVENLPGRRIGFVSSTSSAGFLIPAAGLVRLGYDPDQVFEEVRFMGSYGAGVDALLAGELDVTVMWASDGGDPRDGYAAGILRSLIDQQVLTLDDITILWESPVIPGGPGIVRTALPQEARDLLRGVLTAMPFADPEAFRTAEGETAARYVPVGANSYAAMTELNGN